MRRVLFTALALLPGLAHAQVAASSGTRNPAAPLTLQAKVSPVSFARPVASTAPAASPVARTVSPIKFQDVIKAELNKNVGDYAAEQSGELSFSFGEANTTAPKLIHVVDRQLPSEAVSELPGPVAIRMVVNPQGVPEQLTVVRSAGAVVDAKTLEAVRQYRFQPATSGSVPVVADVTVDIVMKKK